MLRLNYKAEALQQIHTGADENHGTTTLLRREKRKLKNKIELKSRFKNEQHRREHILLILLSVYRSIDKELKSKYYGYYDAFASKVIAATSVKTKHQFLTKLTESCGVRTLHADDIQVVMNSIDMFNDDEMLGVLRDEIQYIMLMLRDRIQTKGQANLFVDKSEEKEITFEKNFEMIPLIQGNSIRGLLRRLCIKDFFLLLGFDKKEQGVDKDMYHQLMTGGNITSSTAFEDIALREEYVRLCPMIGLFGSAIGNMTIQGKMKVGGLRPLCREHGNAEYSFWETIGREFGTRLDSSKTENEIEIIGQQEDRNADQMKYEFEVFNTGTVFDSDFFLTTNDEILVSAFWRCIVLLKEFGYIAGNSARGYGKMDFQIEVPKDADKKYLDYIKNNKKECLKYFVVEREKQLDVLA